MKNSFPSSHALEREQTPGGIDDVDENSASHSVIDILAVYELTET